MRGLAYIVAIVRSAVQEELQSVSSCRNRVLRFAISSGNLKGTLNEFVEKQTNEVAEGIGNKVQSLFHGGTWGQVNYSMFESAMDHLRREIGVEQFYVTIV